MYKFMHIAGVSESETVWSNIYAYFMNAKNEPEYALAFTNALLELCSLERSEILPDSTYCVRTEVSAGNHSEKDNSKRIDILIEGSKSIIIENKVNHLLNNPLDKYWQYAIRPAILVVLTISRISEQELIHYCIRNKYNDVKCINITHYDFITKAKELYGKDFQNPILNELESIIMIKSMILPDNLFINNTDERIAANKIYEQETRRREMIVRECLALKAFDEFGTQLITFKSCPNNTWIHFRYRGQDDLVIGVLCAYLWDWERYIIDRGLRSNNETTTIMQPPVITLFVQVHGELYKKMKRDNAILVKNNGYENKERQYCHVTDFDIDIADSGNKYCRKGELASLLTTTLQNNKNCRVLEFAEEIFKTYVLKE